VEIDGGPEVLGVEQVREMTLDQPGYGHHRLEPRRRSMSQSNSKALL
jgi:hypothetical protein